MDGRMPRENSILLTQVSAQGVFVVDSISDRDAATVRFLRTNGITRGVRLLVRDRHVNDGYAVSIGKTGKVLHLSDEAAGAIRIQRRP
jgi:hypothetical protein